MNVVFFKNGSTMASDNNEQVPLAQKSWLLVFCEYLENIGFDPTNHEFEMPNGSVAKIFKTSDEDGYNWKIIG